ncbi:hypothetical protein GCM10022240_28180 [Microbacterium kribbense]|uniref:Uncharacterized protein n=1 Tax=Microbacterium kribbense TaxID=433645 RepID=A0ABP7GW08_9MICO
MVPGSRSPKEWLSDVRRGLEQMATVSNIAIQVRPEHLPERAEHPGAAEPSADADSEDDNISEGFWVEPEYGSISFEVHIPERLQKDILSDGSISRRKVGAEHFRVRTEYAFHGPATFVWVLDDVDPSEVNGSDAVLLVYRFTNQELQRGGTGVRMARVGPSPFHMDALLRASTSPQEAALSVARIAMYGYESVEFLYDRERSEGLDEAGASLEDSLRDQLSLYYWLQRQVNRDSREVGALADSTDQLVRDHSGTGLSGWWTRVLRSSASARRLGLQALNLQTRETERAGFSVAMTKRILAQSDTLPAFEPYLRQLSDENNQALISNARDVVQFVETGRRSDFEVLMISAATVLGGVAGGVVGFIAAAAGAS